MKNLNINGFSDLSTEEMFTVEGGGFLEALWEFIEPILSGI